MSAALALQPPPEAPRPSPVFHRPLTGQKVVTFRVAGRAFGVDVGAVREIKGWQPATPLPNVASHVLGVINLRGAIIAVYDLNERLGLGRSSITRSSVVIVVDMGERLAGVLVDAVSDIVDVAEEDVRPPPEADRFDGSTPLLASLLVKGEAVISILDLEAVVREGAY